MKTPLVLISGLLSNAFVWQHQVRSLGEIADIHIFSPKEESASKMVQAILEKAPPTFALAGHSMGGWLALELLRAAPSRITKVCLVNTTARDDSPEKRARRQAVISRCQAGAFKEVAQELARALTANPQSYLEVEKMFLEVGSSACIAQEQAMMNREPSSTILPHIKCPTLVIHAAQDTNFSLGEHEEMVQAIPRAKLAIVDDCGHMSPIERPQAVTTLLRFWLTYF